MADISIHIGIVWGNLKLTCPLYPHTIEYDFHLQKQSGSMSKSKHSEVQIIMALKQVEAGRTAQDAAHGSPDELQFVGDLPGVATLAAEDQALSNEEKDVWRSERWGLELRSFRPTEPAYR